MMMPSPMACRRCYPRRSRSSSLLPPAALSKRTRSGSSRPRLLPPARHLQRRQPPRSVQRLRQRQPRRLRQRMRQRQRRQPPRSVQRLRRPRRRRQRMPLRLRLRMCLRLRMRLSALPMSASLQAGWARGTRLASAHTWSTAMHTSARLHDPSRRRGVFTPKRNPPQRRQRSRRRRPPHRRLLLHRRLLRRPLRVPRARLR